MRHDKRTTVYIDSELYTKAKVFCIENDVSLRDLINDALTEKIKK